MSLTQHGETLLAHWPLAGDCRDHSGHGHHALNHGVQLATGEFDGQGAHLEIPDAPALRLGRGDFSFTAWVCLPKEAAGAVADIASKFDPDRRRGFTLVVGSSSGGYQGPGNDRQLHFGIDDAQLGTWQDCGRPNPASNYVSNSLTVFNGQLYAATTGSQNFDDGCRVFRHEGGQQWTDCGRVGQGRTAGVGPLLVHDGDLYAVTWTYDWTRVLEGGYDAGRLYRYAGGTRWEDCGEVGGNMTNNCAASFRGQVVVGGGPLDPGVFARDAAGRWSPLGRFTKTGPRRCFPHAMTRYRGRLIVGFPGVHAFDGESWTFAGLPAGGPHEMLQTHSLHAYQGRLCAGTWPYGRVTVHQGGETWAELGRVGEDGTEVNALVVYNGKLYGGSIPRAEVCRYDGQPAWTSLARFYSPPGWTPAPPGPDLTRAELNAWSRVTSLTVHDGKLFASTGSCTSSILDAPCDVRGQVFCLEAGRCASFGGDAGLGWHHVVAVRRAGRLELYLDGRQVATSSAFASPDYDLSNASPLRLGFGQSDYFHGQLRDIRLYGSALAPSALRQLAAAPSAAPASR